MNRLAVVAPLFFLPATADAAIVLLSRHDADQIVKWDSTKPDVTTLVHTAKSNDVDYNTAEGTMMAWIVERDDDAFARFDILSAIGLDEQFNLGDPGLTHYDFPKHLAAFNGEVVVMSRNDGTLWRYDEAGTQLGSVKTPVDIGQGLATDGTDLFVSVWNDSPSLFFRYDETFTILQTIDNPTGMAELDNIYDLVHDPETGHFFGLATVGEFGTQTLSNTVLEFTMGGAVLATHTLPLKADGIGRFHSVACGDSYVEASEECDDGNLLDSDGCTAACTLAMCGDGVVWADVEDCDDANDDETDACSTGCALAFCGDAAVWAGVEACDDGNDDDDDECTNACALPICGDGIVQADEQCDDPDPLLCDQCVLVPIDLSTTDVSTTDTGDDASTTTSTTTAVDPTTADDTTSTTSTTSSTGTPSDDTTGGEASSGSTGGPTDLPTSGAETGAATTTTAAPAGNSGFGGESSDDGCGCTTAPPLSLAWTLLLLAAPRRRRR